MTNWFEKRRVGMLPQEAAARYHDRVALVFGQEQWTFPELAAEVDRTAKALMAAGVMPGDKIAVWLNNMPRWIFLMYAIAKVGGVIVPLNTRYRSADFSHAIRASDSRLLVLQDVSGPIDYYAMLAEAMPEIAAASSKDLALEDFPCLRSIITIAGQAFPATTDWDDFIAAGQAISDAALDERARAVDPDAPLIIAFTSGTTGHPKGAVHSHICLRNLTDCASRLGITFMDALVNYLPLFHLFSYSHNCLLSLVTGAKQILLPSFDAATALEAIETHKGTIIYGFDTHFKDLMAAAEAGRHDLGRHDLGSLRLGIFATGQPGSRALAVSIQSALCPTVSAYGMTEFWTAPLISFANSTLEQRTESSGFPLPGYEVRIVDPETGADLPCGQQGEILIRGYTMMSGYYKNPAATAEVLDADGWFRTGDAGVLRPDGHMTFIGRFKDILKVGGENIAPAEIESYLAGHEGIAAVAVVGAPDERLGEVPAAYIVPKPGRTLTAGDIDGFCRGKIASFKIPRHVFFVETLPMTSTGKVQKHLLRDQLRQQLVLH